MINTGDLVCAFDVNKSGYRYVNDKRASGKGGPKPFQAVVGTNPHFKGERTNRFIGPSRATAMEAAMDACAVLNLSSFAAWGRRARRPFGKIDRSVVA